MLNIWIGFAKFILLFVSNFFLFFFKWSLSWNCQYKVLWNNVYALICSIFNVPRNDAFPFCCSAIEYVFALIALVRKLFCSVLMSQYWHWHALQNPMRSNIFSCSHEFCSWAKHVRLDLKPATSCKWILPLPFCSVHIKSCSVNFYLCRLCVKWYISKQKKSKSRSKLHHEVTSVIIYWPADVPPLEIRSDVFAHWSRCPDDGEQRFARRSFICSDATEWNESSSTQEEPETVQPLFRDSEKSAVSMPNRQKQERKLRVVCVSRL